MNAISAPGAAGKAGAAVPASGARAGASARTRIGRRSIHDLSGAVVGYELLFRPGPGLADAPEEVRDRSTSEVIATAFGAFGLHRLGERRNLYVNATRSLLTGETPMPFGPGNVVLEVVEDLVVDADVMAGVTYLKQRGYRLATDGRGTGHEQLLGVVDVVKLDVGAGVAPARLAASARGSAPQARLMAASIRSDDVLKQCIEAGFDLMEGPYFDRVAPGPSATVSPSQTVSLQLLAALSSADTTVAEVERIVSADPGLSVRILGTVNSASGTGRQVTSMSQAIVLLGRRSLSAWVMLAALGGNPDDRRQDMIDVLTRARTCELLAPLLIGIEPSTAYAVGLLSGVVEVMGADPARIARSTRLTDELTSALVERRGQVGRLLAAIEQFERTGQIDEPDGGGLIDTALSDLAEAVLVIATSDVSRAHLHALGTAVDTIDSILGPPPSPPAGSVPG